jgi:hypothetical protein
MKKFIKKLWVFITSLQFGLSIIAFLSWFQAYTIGRRTSVGQIFTENQDEFIPSATDVTSGHDGGALAMGLICCVCIIMIVWIEINKKTKP